MTSSSKIAELKEAAKIYFGIVTTEEKVNFDSRLSATLSNSVKKSRSIHKRIAPQRPLMVKTSSTQAPLVFCLTNLGNGDNQEKANSDSLLNSYQKAKLKNAEKFKCNICGKGFPLSCLLRRHIRIHSDHKPFKCSFCLKTFSSKATCRHHLFMKHAEEAEAARKLDGPITEDGDPADLKSNQVTSEIKGSLPIEIIGVDIDNVSKPGITLDNPSQGLPKNIDSKNVENNMYYWI